MDGNTVELNRENKMAEGSLALDRCFVQDLSSVQCCRCHLKSRCEGLLTPATMIRDGKCYCTNKDKERNSKATAVSKGKGDPCPYRCMILCAPSSHYFFNTRVYVLLRVTGNNNAHTFPLWAASNANRST